jgi:EF-P beta-lysylation protein EpmB
VLSSSPELWKSIMRQNFTQWEKLSDFLELDALKREFIHKTPNFPLNLPYRLAAKIAKNTLDDPILKQFLPTLAELKTPPGFTLDPVQDAQFRKAPKLLHKYQGRALLVCTSACAMHCRFCFRQNFAYETQAKGFEKELEQIAEDASLQEIILSGGDPLSLSNHTLKHLLDSLSQLKHIRRVRFHTRFPIGIPERIDEGFLSLFENRPFRSWFVLHINHPQELDQDVFTHLDALQRQGVMLLNQWVLLKEVNDSPAVLKELCELLVNHGIFPYYLHQLDRVQGGAHFEVSVERGKELIEEIAKSLPGYAVPKYVREIAGEANKTPLF